MNIFNKVALEGLKKSRTRTLVTIIGVALSAAMITAVATFGVSLQNYLINGAAVKCGDWHIGYTDVPSSFLQEQASDDRVAGIAAYENIGYAMLDGGTNPDKPYLFIAGFSKETFDTLPVTLLSGRLPQNSGEVLVPAHVASNGGVRISVGDMLSLAVGDRMNGNEKLNQHDPYSSGETPGTKGERLVPTAVKGYKVVGIYQRPAFEEYAAPGYTLITITDKAAGESFSAFVTLKNPVRLHSYTNDVIGDYDYFLNNDVLRFMGLSNDQGFNTLLYSIAGILIVLIMIGSVFLIYNSFSISMNERMHQFGILLSVGATEKQLRNSVLFEGLCIGAIGIPLGVLSGIPSIKAVLLLVAKNFGNVMYDTVPLKLVVSVPAIIAAAAVSLITILISAYLPARRAAATPVMECIRQTNEIKVQAKEVKTSKFMSRIYGLPGTLALKNFKRNKRRYRSIVLSLTLSVVLFVAVSAFKIDLSMLGEQSTVEIDGDILFQASGMPEEEFLLLYEELKGADGVSESTYQALATYSCVTDDFPDAFLEDYRRTVGDTGTGKTIELPLEVQFIEDDIYQDFLAKMGFPDAEYTGENAKLLIVGINASTHETLFTNSSMDFTLREEAGEQTKTISATFVDTYPLDPPPTTQSVEGEYVFMAVAPYSMKPQFDVLLAPVNWGMTFWSENPAQSTAQMKTMLEGAGITSEYSLYNVYEVLEENRNMVFILNVFTIVFVTMISLIAVANVFNTISTNIKLRRRELAMLRSVGMSVRDFNRMMRFECVLYGARTLLLGLPIAGILSWLIYKAMVVGGLEGTSFVFPWSSMAISILGVFLVIFITMLYAVNRIKKENIIDALRDDMT